MLQLIMTSEEAIITDFELQEDLMDSISNNSDIKFGLIDGVKPVDQFLQRG